MVRLISANLLRLRHSAVFMLCMAFSLGASLFFTVSRALEVNRQPGFYTDIDSMYSSPEMVMFGGGVFLIFAAAVFVALFIGIDYSDGVIRNKLIIGHERMAVYGANLLTAVIVSLLIIAVYNGISFGLGLVILPSRCLTAVQIAQFTVGECLAVSSLTAILTAISMLISSRSVSAVTIVMLTFIMLFAAAGIYSKLSASYAVSEHVEISVDPETGKETRTVVTDQIEDRLSPGERFFWELLHSALPVDQLYRIGDLDDEELELMMGYSIVLITLTSGVGMLVFCRKDLK